MIVQIALNMWEVITLSVSWKHWSPPAYLCSQNTSMAFSEEKLTDAAFLHSVECIIWARER